MWYIGLEEGEDWKKTLSVFTVLYTIIMVHIGMSSSYRSESASRCSSVSMGRHRTTCLLCATCIQTPWTPEPSLCESRTARRSMRYIVVVRCSSLRACWSISVEHSARSSQEPQSDSYNFHAPSQVLSLFSVLISYWARLGCDHINALYKFTITYIDITTVC